MESIKNFKKAKIAIVHDFLNQYGGAERVLETLIELFPQAPIYTIIYESENLHHKFKDKEIHTSFFQNLPKFLRKRLKYCLPFLPVAPETFDLRDFDLVISSSGAWSKGIITRLNTIHIAYIHSPMRFVWDYNERYLRDERKEGLGFFLRPILSYLRLWDKIASDRPDYLIANSQYTQKRIEKYYRRSAEVIYPPVELKKELETSQILEGMKGEKRYFLIVSRLSSYKKIKEAVEVFNKLELPLVIVGEGKEKKVLEKIAGTTIKFLGWQPDSQLPALYSKARAFIFSGVDDFGMAPVEAMQYGVPVIALKEGGAIELIEEGKTGEFFEASTSEVMADGIRRFCEKEKGYDHEYIKEQAKRFTKRRFKKEFQEYLNKILD